MNDDRPRFAVITHPWPCGFERANIPADVAALVKVDEAIRNGHRLPRWGWPVPGAYNGATGAERVRGWEATWIARKIGLLPWPEHCSICARGSGLGFHAELYGRPLLVKPVCRSCHFHIHRRFRNPDRWQSFVGEWPDIAWLARIPVVELCRSAAQSQEAEYNPLGLAGD